MSTFVNNEQMTTIDKNPDVVTLINVFIVEPENQQRLVELIVEATEELASKLPAFISSNIHKSLDGCQLCSVEE